jgi:hypothetical protein
MTTTGWDLLHTLIVTSLVRLLNAWCFSRHATARQLCICTLTWCLTEPCCAVSCCAVLCSAVQDLVAPFVGVPRRVFPEASQQRDVLTAASCASEAEACDICQLGVCDCIAHDGHVCWQQRHCFAAVQLRTLASLQRLGSRLLVFVLDGWANPQSVCCARGEEF